MATRSSRWQARRTVDAGKGFFGLLPEAFAYPLRGQAKFLLLVGALFFLIFEVIGSLVALLGFGYMCAFLFDVAGTSAMGHADVPGWPDFTDFVSDILSPVCQAIGAAAICLLPAAGALVLGGLTDHDTLVASLVLLILGVMAYPMALLRVALGRSVSALNPIAIAGSILRVPVEYLAVCLALGVAITAYWVVEAFVLSSVPVLGTVVGGVLSFYLLVVQMRLLGLLYYTRGDVLDWFGVE